ncbi:MAG: tetratricopeptide repeat protein [Gammaproteobacteria bacterium]|nr:tetratricopeptide repeat protein [Gammaproteobacteria bacterium]MDH5802708.1 tetratricopeptide repeat protein [Gammaproteobacteria bacterium]
MTIAEESLRSGDLTEALKQLQDQVRKDPSNVQYRIFLFQLLCVLGQWDRALTQLNVSGEMDASTLAMVHMYREALQCEALRTDIFSGKRTPLVFGEPQQWIALVLEALKLSANGKHAESQALREQAYDVAPVVSGKINDESFEWLADADSRIGPFLEAIVNGNYYWIPFQRIKKINIDAPEDLRDMVWMPAYFTWDNGGETVGLIPSRYAGSEGSDDNDIRLCRKTQWDEMAEGVYYGIGQRLFTTDTQDVSLLDTRTIEFDLPEIE